MKENSFKSGQKDGFLWNTYIEITSISNNEKYNEKYRSLYSLKELIL